MGCVLEAFRRQSHFCGETGSPFPRSLLACGPDNIVAGGAVAQLTDAWPACRVPLRFPVALPERYLPHMTQWEKGQRSETTLADVDPHV